MTKINKITEQVNIKSKDIDYKKVIEILSIINEEDSSISKSVNQALPDISIFINEAIERMSKSGRLIYLGSGTSGRLGILDASECSPTFGVPKKLVQGIISGGDRAIKESIEGAEDSLTDSITILKSIDFNSDDIILGISASGTTPFVLTALKYANQIGAVTGFLTCNNLKPITYVDHLIKVIVGPEVISGSTRMKAGTATKMVLNMISTTSMIKLNHTHGNIMVDLLPKNKKLIERSLSILMNELSLNKEEANKIYVSSNQNLKIAILMGKKDCSYESAYKQLKDNQGNLKKALK